MVQAEMGVVMAGKWKDVALEDVADEITVGYVGPMASEYVENGVPFLRSLNVEPLRVNKNDLKFITPEFHHKIKKSRLTPDDVVIVRTGKPGACSVVPEWLYDANCSDLVIVRCGDQLDKRFLAFYVNTMATNHIAAHLVGAVQQHFNVGAARTMRIKLPPLGEQKSIAHILGTLDDKIELNRRMNVTLEGMAQALFKSWFIDFDPVIDNILVKNMAKCSDQNQPSPNLSQRERDNIFDGIPDEFAERAEIRRQALADGTANREAAKSFPTAFQQTETMGWIPDGWTECMFDVLAKPKKGKNITKQTIIEGNIPVVAGGLHPAYFHNAPNVYAPVITISASGANAGFVNLYQQDIWASDCTYISSKETGFVYSTFLFLKNRQDQITHMQQGAAQPHVYPKDLLRLRLANPPRTRWQEMETTIAPLFHKISVNEKENQNLTKLRDTLLPKLISGELRIEDAEKITEET